METARRREPSTANSSDESLRPKTESTVPRMEDQYASESLNESIGKGRWSLGFSRCLGTGDGKTERIKNGHPVVFGVPRFPGGRQERLQFRKALREEARAVVFRAGLRQGADGADLASGDEADEDPRSFFGGDPVQQPFHPFAAPRSGRIPIFESENVGPETVDQFVDHAGGFRVIRFSDRK